MEKTSTNIRKDWRDSLATKIGVSILTGALCFGLGKLAYDLNQEATTQNCAEYGFLEGKPVGVQRHSIRESLNEKSWLFRSNFGLRPDVKDWAVDLIIKDLKNCNYKSTTK